MQKQHKGGSKYYCCDICHRIVHVRILLFEKDHICIKCSESVPKHIPKLQKRKYLNEQVKNVKLKKEI